MARAFVGSQHCLCTITDAHLTHRPALQGPRQVAEKAEFVATALNQMAARASRDAHTFLDSAQALSVSAHSAAAEAFGGIGPQDCWGWMQGAHRWLLSVQAAAISAGVVPGPAAIKE